jgi:hypothetical protein
MKQIRTTTRFELAILYRIVMKRITSNQSPMQLSFLIGKPDDYVSRVEMLETGFYSAEDIRCIATALQDEETLLFYPFNPDDTKVQVELEKEYFKNYCIYSCTIVNAEGEKENYFSLTDDTEFNQLSQELDDDEFSLASDGLLLLIQGNYFAESRMAIEPYMAINFFLQRTLRPDALKAALQDLTFAQVPLIGMIGSDNSRIAYQQC